MAVADGTGVRVRLRSEATIAGTGPSAIITSNLRDNPAPRPAIPGQDPPRYFKQWWVDANAADTHIYVDIDSIPGDRAANQNMDLSADAEANWEVAVRHERTGAVLGPVTIRHGPTTDDVYRLAVTPQQLRDWRAQYSDGDVCTFIMFDPRVSRTIGTAFDTARPGRVVEEQTRAVNSEGAGAPSAWAEPRAVDEAEPPLETALPAAVRQTVYRPQWTTSLTLTGPAGASAPMPVSVTAPAPPARRPDAVRVELGSISAAGEFESATGPLSFIGSRFQLGVRAHSPAWCKAVVRAATQDAAAALIAHAAMRVQAVSADRVSTLFLGLIDDTRCGYGEEADSKAFAASVHAVTMLKKAGQSRLLSTEVEGAATPLDEPRPDDALSPVSGTGGLFGASYDVDAPPIAHFRHRAEDGGPALLADARDWPSADIRVTSPLDDPLTYVDLAREIGAAVGGGWQLAQDGFLRPMLNGSHPARVLSFTDGHFGLISRDVAPFAVRRNFRLIDNPPGVAPGDFPAGVGTAGRHVATAGDPPVQQTAPDGSPVYDHAEGAARVMRWRDVPWRGGAARLYTIVALDPGGYGAHYPLPPLAAPILARVSVRRVAAASGGAVAQVKDVDDFLLSADGEVLKAPATVSPEDAARRPPEPTGNPLIDVIVATVNSYTYPASRTWTITPTHVVREGWLNDYPQPDDEQSVGAAYRDRSSGWRFQVTLDVLDEIRAPQEVTWNSLYPLEIGRRVDFAGLPGPVGGLRVTRLDATLLNEFPGDLRMNWKITASQAAELEEATDGVEYWRSQRRP